jgi:Zn finger protein HypA/HybF involved in hydrogenase expression
MARPTNPSSILNKTCPTCKKEFTCKSWKPKTYCCKHCAASSHEVKEKNRTGVKIAFDSKYGGHPMATNVATKEKLKQTLTDVYGVTHYSKTDDFVNQVRETKLEKYGNSNYNNVEKIKSTCLEKYGVDNYRKTEEYKKQYKETCLKKYGVVHASKSDNFKFGGKSSTFKHTHKLSMFKKFCDSEKFKNFTPLFDLTGYDGVTVKYNRPYRFKCIRCSGEHDYDLTKQYLRCPICDKNTSTFQSGVEDFIKEILPNEAIVSNNRAILSPREIDIYIPNKNIAIETNGVYWHSEVSGSKNKNYHLNKTKMCLTKGIRLIHIFESEWNHQKEIVKSILKKILLIDSQRVNEAECEIKEISPEIKSDFLKENHLDGNDNSEIRLGLYYKKLLIQVMTFSKSKFKKDIHWEVSRNCTKLGYQIEEGMSKLFQWFVLNHAPITVSAYSDRRYFSGETYIKLGFNFHSNTPPNYHYIIDNYDTLQSRINWQKGKLEKKLLSFDKSISEWENMKMNNFDRIWDCGHSKWIYNNKNL